jgi:hypothetical protein
MSFHCHSLRDRFLYVKNYSYQILEIRYKESGSDLKMAGNWPKHVVTSRINYQNMTLRLCKYCLTMFDDHVGLAGAILQFYSVAPYRFDYRFVDE